MGKKITALLVIGSLLLSLGLVGCKSKEVINDKDTELEEIENKPSSADKRHKAQEKRLNSK